MIMDSLIFSLTKKKSSKAQIKLYNHAILSLSLNKSKAINYKYQFDLSTNTSKSS